MGGTQGVSLSQQAWNKLFPECKVKLTRCDYIGDMKIEIPGLGLSPSPSTLSSSQSNQNITSSPSTPPPPPPQGGSKKQEERSSKKCGVCGKLFANSWNVNTHMRIHTGHRPYKCNICGKRMRQLAHIQRHIRLCHQIQDKSAYSYEPEPEKEKVASLNESGSCPVNSDLQKLKASTSPGVRVRNNPAQRSRKVKVKSTGLKSAKQEIMSNQCKFCGKCFSNGPNLQAHIRIHTNERPYVCRKCEKTFKQCGHVQKHILNRHPGTSRFFYAIKKRDSSRDSTRVQKISKGEGKRKKGPISKIKRTGPGTMEAEGRDDRKGKAVASPAKSILKTPNYDLYGIWKESCSSK